MMGQGRFWKPVLSAVFAWLKRLWQNVGKNLWRWRQDSGLCGVKIGCWEADPAIADSDFAEELLSFLRTGGKGLGWVYGWEVGCVGCHYCLVYGQF